MTSVSSSSSSSSVAPLLINIANDLRLKAFHRLSNADSQQRVLDIVENNIKACDFNLPKKSQPRFLEFLAGIAVYRGSDKEVHALMNRVELLKADLFAKQYPKPSNRPLHDDDSKDNGSASSHSPITNDSITQPRRRAGAAAVLAQFGLESVFNDYLKLFSAYMKKPLDEDTIPNLEQLESEAAELGKMREEYRQKKEELTQIERDFEKQNSEFASLSTRKSQISAQIEVHKNSLLKYKEFFQDPTGLENPIKARNDSIPDNLKVLVQARIDKINISLPELSKELDFLDVLVSKKSILIKQQESVVREKRDALSAVKADFFKRARQFQEQTKKAEKMQHMHKWSYINNYYLTPLNVLGGVSQSVMECLNMSDLEKLLKEEIAAISQLLHE